MSCETSQLLSKVKPNTPNFASAGWASTMRRTKKNAISARIPQAGAVRTRRRARAPEQALRREWGDGIALNERALPLHVSESAAAFDLASRSAGSFAKNSLSSV